MNAPTWVILGLLFFRQRIDRSSIVNFLNTLYHAAHFGPPVGPLVSENKVFGFESCAHPKFFLQFGFLALCNFLFFDISCTVKISAFGYNNYHDSY